MCDLISKCMCQNQTFWSVLVQSLVLTCCPVCVLLALLLFFSLLFLFFIFSLLENFFQSLRGQVVPEHPLGDAVGNATFTERREKTTIKIKDNLFNRIWILKASLSACIYSWGYSSSQPTCASLQKCFDGALCCSAACCSLRRRHKQQSLQHQHILQLANTHHPLLQLQGHRLPLRLQLSHTKTEKSVVIVVYIMSSRSTVIVLSY